MFAISAQPTVAGSHRSFIGGNLGWMPSLQRHFVLLLVPSLVLLKMADKNMGPLDDLMEQTSGREGQSAELAPPLEANTTTRKGKKGRKGSKSDIDSLVTQVVNTAFQTHLQDIFKVHTNKPRRKRHFSYLSSASESLSSNTYSEPPPSQRRDKAKSKPKKRTHREPSKRSRKRAQEWNLSLSSSSSDSEHGGRVIRGGGGFWGRDLIAAPQALPS